MYEYGTLPDCVKQHHGDFWVRSARVLSDLIYLDFDGINLLYMFIREKRFAADCVGVLNNRFFVEDGNIYYDGKLICTGNYNGVLFGVGFPIMEYYVRSLTFTGRGRKIADKGFAFFSCYDLSYLGGSFKTKGFITSKESAKLVLKLSAYVDLVR